MPKRTLQLRSLPIIAFAYVVAPLVALTILSLGVSLSFLMAGRLTNPLGGVAGEWLGVVGTGFPLCLLVELIIVTPMLIAFRRYRWKWLIGWSACVSGFLTGAIFCVVVVGMVFGWDQSIGSAPLALVAGFVGLTIALIFRLIAVRTVAVTPG
jgi:hypothetical protein